MTHYKQSIKRFPWLGKVITSAMAMCAAASLLLVSCSESDEPQPENTLLTINIQAPDAARTRADEGEVSALEAENKMYYAWIWVFETKAGRDAAETDTDTADSRKTAQLLIQFLVFIFLLILLQKEYAPRSPKSRVIIAPRTSRLKFSPRNRTDASPNAA